MDKRVTVQIGNADDGNGFIDGSNPTNDANISHTTIETALNAGTNVTITTGGNGSPGASNGDITVNSAISATTGTAGSTGSLTLSAYRNIIVNAAITEGSPGTVIGGGVTLRADNGGNGSGYINIGANITSNGGNITLGGGSGAISAGNGYAYGNAGQASGVYVNANVNAGGGNIIVNGNGYTGGVNTSSAYGVYFYGGTQQTSGSGTIAINGTGGGSGSGSTNDGVYLLYNTLSVAGGNLTVTGTGGGTTGSGNDGVSIDGNTVQTTGAGTITMTGIGGGSGTSSSDAGINFYGGSVKSTGTGGGGITLVGYSGDNGGSGGLGSNWGVALVNTPGNSISSKDGAILIEGNTGKGGQAVSTDTSGTDYGVAVVWGAISSTGNASITITGIGAGSGTAANNAGVLLTGGSNTSVTSAGGGITLNGTGGNAGGSGATNIGVYDSGTIQSTSGVMSITGTGGGGTGSTSYGVEFDGGTIATGSNTITVTGNGGGSGASHDNYGVYVTSTAGGTIKSTGAGAVNVTGIGGDAGGSGNSNDGVYVDAANGIQAASGSSITVNGSGSSCSNGLNLGVSIISSSITGGGNGTGVSITGLGGNDSGSANTGVLVSHSTVSNTGSGTVTIIGTGQGTGNSGSDLGVNMGNTGVISTVDGLLTVTGTGGGAGTGANNHGVNISSGSGSNSTIKTTGSGNIIINGIAGNQGSGSSYGVDVNIANGIQTTGTGNITVSTDTINLNQANDINSIGNLTVAPHTAGVAVDVGGTSNGTLGLPDSLLSDIAAGSITIGDRTNTGNMTVETADTFSAPITLLTAGGSNLTLSHSLTDTASGNAIVLVSGNNFTNTAGSSGISASNGRWLVYSTNPANDTIGALANGFRRFSCTYGGSCPTFPGIGNGLLYSYTPTLTATPNAASTTYGSAVPGFAYTLSGYLGSDSGSDSVTGTPGYSTNYSQGNNVGNYNITSTAGSLASALGYGFAGATLNNGLTVNAASLSVTADAKSKTYGSANPALTYQYSGLVNGDTSSVFSGGLTTPATASSNVGNYAINQGSLAAGSNYTISYTGANLTVNAATLSVTADAKSKTYGAANPALTYQYSGLVNGDTSSVFSGGLTTPATASSNVGNYAINQGSLAAGSNYTISYTGANLTVNAATLSITADSKSGTSGLPIPALTYTYSGLVNNDTSGVFGGGLSTAATIFSPAGNYNIAQGTLSAGGNYTISYTPGTLSLAAAAGGGPVLIPVVIGGSGGTTTILPTSGNSNSSNTHVSGTGGSTLSAVISGNASLFGESTFYDGGKGIVIASSVVDNPFAMQLIGKPFNGVDTRPVPGSNADNLSLLASLEIETLSNEFEEPSVDEIASPVMPAVYYTRQPVSKDETVDSAPTSLDRKAIDSSANGKTDKPIKKEKARRVPRNNRSQTGRTKSPRARNYDPRGRSLAGLSAPASNPRVLSIDIPRWLSSYIH